jgi:hypothetical protein
MLLDMSNDVYKSGVNFSLNEIHEIFTPLLAPQMDVFNVYGPMSGIGDTPCCSLTRLAEA